ncbi:MAG: HAMP domain-containing protein [Bdellovibrionaceae bacterium]|nr:HAMP domain-containing protein [Pseudobdellovibrionaceae bacterium]MBX3033148.1 HAMP domain-containing protein [Pseudobdellovibrionaceae bacterium]
MFSATLRRLIGGFSLRSRLTLLYVLIFGVSTVFFNSVIFLYMMETLQRDFDDALFNYAVDVSDSIDIGPRGDLTFPPLRVDNGKILPFPLGTALIQVRHISGEVLARVGDFGLWDPPYKKDFQILARGDEASYRTVEDVHLIPNAEADSYRMINFPLDSAAKPQIILQIAVPTSLLETQFRYRLTLLQLGIPLILLIAVMGGYFVSTRAMAPVNHMIETAKAIDASELNQRIPVPPAQDEIRRLAETLNQMLARIQLAFQSQERFIADASHQLLTPLTIMKNELETMARGPRTPDEIARFVPSAQQEVESLVRIVQDMLLLARVDAGLGALNLQELYLDDIVLESLSRCEKTARQRHVRLVFDVTGAEGDRAPVRGDADLLQHLIINIIENAVKYSPPNDSVRLELRWTPDEAILQVQDHGPGIPPAELPFIFERFRRAPGADRQAQGFGLGLAIARQIAHLHTAELSGQNHPQGGAMFILRMKKN